MSLMTQLARKHPTEAGMKRRSNVGIFPSSFVSSLAEIAEGNLRPYFISLSKRERGFDYSQLVNISMPPFNLMVKSPTRKFALIINGISYRSTLFFSGKLNLYPSN